MRSRGGWLAAVACLNLAAARAIRFCGTPPPDHRAPQRQPMPGGPCHVLLCNTDRERRGGSG